MSIVAPSEANRASQLYTADAKGHRLWVYPAEVAGKYRAWRTRLNAVLLVIFLVLPWLRINGHQAVLLDILHGKFAILGLSFWAHDAPMLFFVFGGAIVSLFWATSVWGRVWCGWACPQTVYLDAVFRRIERWIEGDAVRRRALDKSPWNGVKVRKKAAKWALFTLAAMIISHSFLAYFVGTGPLLEMMTRSPLESPFSFFVMSAFVVLMLFDFGWFREQFCTLLCPYGRFQSVLMDEESLAVVYDKARGEPRRGTAPTGQPLGDCVGCNRCVSVCPTGIDIRNGMQIECIACTSCADACDAVMRKVGKTEGLIRYQWGSSAATASSKKTRWLRPRPLAYMTVLFAIIGGFTLALSRRQPMEATFIRNVGAPYQVIAVSGGESEVVNHFRVDLLNQTFETQTVSVSLPESWTRAGMRLVSAALPAEVIEGQRKRIDVFFRFPVSAMKEGRGAVQLNLDYSPANGGAPVRVIQEVTLVGPLR